jgi:hypothetical protein
LRSGALKYLGFTCKLDFQIEFCALQQAIAILSRCGDAELNTLARFKSLQIHRSVHQLRRLGPLIADYL